LDTSRLDSRIEELGFRGATACTAAGITYRQLDYWARTGLLEPSIRTAAGSGSARLYGFRDILVLKIILGMRNRVGRMSGKELGESFNSSVIIEVHRVGFLSSRPELDSGETLN